MYSQEVERGKPHPGRDDREGDLEEEWWFRTAHKNKAMEETNRSTGLVPVATFNENLSFCVVVDTTKGGIST